VDKDEASEINPGEKKISVDIDDAIAQGVYSNLVLSNFRKEECILDFVFIQPHVPKGKILSRVVLSPRNAKHLAQILSKNVSDYEDKFGTLNDNNQFPGINFSNN
jgi:hypothetical protein